MAELEVAEAAVALPYTGVTVAAAAELVQVLVQEADDSATHEADELADTEAALTAAAGLEATSAQDAEVEAAGRVTVQGQLVMVKVVA